MIKKILKGQDYLAGQLKLLIQIMITFDSKKAKNCLEEFILT